MDLTFETCSGLLGKVVVSVEEVSFEESLSHDRVDWEGLVLGHYGELSGMGLGIVTDSIQ